jgi:hypothetical protein
LSNYFEAGSSTLKITLIATKKISVITLLEKKSGASNRHHTWMILIQKLYEQALQWYCTKHSTQA